MLSVAGVSVSGVHELVCCSLLGMAVGCVQSGIALARGCVCALVAGASDVQRVMMAALRGWQCASAVNT